MAIGYTHYTKTVDTVHYTLHIVYIHTTHYTLHTKPFTLYTTDITLHTSHYTHHATHITLHTIHYTHHTTLQAQAQATWHSGTLSSAAGPRSLVQGASRLLGQ